MRYTVNAPTGRPDAAGALMPGIPRTPAASSRGIVQVYGQPGTQGIAAPRPSALPQISGDPRTMPSRTSPDVMFPSLYRASAAGMHAPVAVRSTNELPVPAGRLVNMPGIAQRSRRVGGNTQIPQPRVVQTWPAWRGAGN